MLVFWQSGKDSVIDVELLTYKRAINEQYESASHAESKYQVGREKLSPIIKEPGRSWQLNICHQIRKVILRV